MQNSQYTEQELIHSISNNCQKGFSYLYENYGNALYGVIMGIVKNESEACDILQNVFIKIWKNIDKYDASKGRLYTWLNNIARNASIDFLRTTYAQDKTKTCTISSDTHHSIQKREPVCDTFSMSQIVSRLEAKYKTVIDLSFHKGYTHEEIAKLIDVPLGTVKTRIRKAIALIRTDYTELAC